MSDYGWLPSDFPWQPLRPDGRVPNWQPSRLTRVHRYTLARSTGSSLDDRSLIHNHLQHDSPRAAAWASACLSSGPSKSRRTRELAPRAALPEEDVCTAPTAFPESITPTARRSSSP